MVVFCTMITPTLYYSLVCLAIYRGRHVVGGAAAVCCVALGLAVRMFGSWRECASRRDGLYCVSSCPAKHACQHRRRGRRCPVVFDRSVCQDTAQCGCIDRRGDLRRHGFHGGKDRHVEPVDPRRLHKLNRVAHDVCFLLKLGKRSRSEDIDHRVGDEQRLRIDRHVHHEDMT
ncbi:unnamed protein product (plasmid) [Mycetohabitans rhizoxinica HKI 454]|uniref:Uncharacterized protein n=1 Tax=Mycetohabitans rhizoxinica (strain DSM 19002 / CIP 109453 / HKI 454) TaxID=882378 RepID=E5AUQ5_MYCRK|nr:unnamed protein product [Mycetohabitans rhizoxinica HKI 454]